MPPNKGDKIRSFHELKFFSRFFKVDLVTFAESDEDFKYKDALREYCQNIHIEPIHKMKGLLRGGISVLAGKSISEGYYRSNHVREVIQKLTEKNSYHFIFCFSSQVAQYVINRPEKKIMDFCDVDSDKWRQYSRKKRFPFNLLYKLESSRLSKYEHEIATHFSLNLFSTPQELEVFQPQNGINYVLSNGVDTEYFSPNSRSKETAIIFVGAMDYFANIDAVVWFGRKVFPKLLEKIPGLKFYIIGSSPSKAVQKLSSFLPNIIVTGFVRDVRIYMDKAKIAVIPLHIARGIQNKVLEAMSMELPVSIPENILRSLKECDRQNVLVFKDGEDLFNILSHFFSNEQKYRDMGKQLRKYVRQNYDWDSNLDEFRKHLVQEGIW